ncbi:MAG TPA: aspartyl/asparaginyl beta-hydroxylase domain-containing protein [Sphingomicrobium sp.]|nr:aspartyl/asparaginyl beta-hydroxylase domain-containing protein [Sphingomicrobium sp.]
MKRAEEVTHFRPVTSRIMLREDNFVNPGSSDTEELFQAGVAAWRRGDAREAHNLLSRIAAADHENPQLCLLLAYAAKAVGDTAGATNAVEQLLKLEPRNVLGLIMKGDRLFDSGKKRAASHCYRIAVQTASELQLDARGLAEVRRAAQAHSALERDFTNEIENLAANQNWADQREYKRITESLDLLLGRKQIQVQRPTGYYFPQLPDIAIYETGEFEWAAEVERATPVIREEMMSALKEPGAVKPFLATSPDHAPNITGLSDSLDWGAFHLSDMGILVPSNIEKCPQTWATVSNLPLPELSGAAPTVFFSVLRAGARIKSHHGRMNTRLVCHLPLVVPDDCGIRVGNELVSWQEGKLLIFNDAIEHEAWNNSDQDRIVLIFDVWRPEITALERGALTTLFSMINATDT